MVVERHGHVLVEDPLDAVLLARADLDRARGHAIELFRELELAVIGPRLEVLEAAVARVLRALAGLGGLHRHPPDTRRPPREGDEWSGCAAILATPPRIERIEYTPQIFALVPSRSGRAKISRSR